MKKWDRVCVEHQRGNVLKKKTNKWFALPTIVALSLVSFTAFADPAADEALFKQRIDWAMKGGDTVMDVAALTPQEVVRGGRGAPIMRAPAGQSRLSLQAIEAAIALIKPLGTAQLLVWHKGALQLEYYGEGASSQTRSSPASMMKPILALAIGTAIERGKIRSINDPVGRYITEWANDPRGAITIKNILEMSSGLQNAQGFDLTSPGMRHLFGTDIRGIVMDVPLAKPPGTEFQYNNFTSSLGGMVIERATGMRYAQWVSRTVWRPLGARDGAVWLDKEGGFAHTYCCMIATGEDWLRIGLMIKDGGKVGRRQVFNRAWIDAMIAPSALNPNFGYQLWRASPYAAQRTYGPAIPLKVPAAEPFLADDMIYFDGAGGQRVYVSRNADLVIVRIGKSTNNWDDSALPNIISRGLQAVQSQ
jgi:CubicO group peptidase (beta-lactamase class C family)